MFFLNRSKEQNIAEAVKKSADGKYKFDRMVATARAAAVAGAGKSRNGTGFSDSVAAPEPVTDVRELPQGRYLPFKDVPPPGGPIPGNYEGGFALWATGGKQASLLYGPNEFAGRLLFEMRRRCRDAGIALATDVCVSDAVLRILHNQHYQASSEHEGALPTTEIQREAFAMVESAVKKGASDIHMETRGALTDIFFRIHGERFRQPQLDTNNAKRIMRVLYNVHADSQNSGTAWDPASVQDTAIEHTLENGVRVQLRFNSAPIYPGENLQCTLRVLRMDGQSTKALEEVGYSPDMVRLIEEMLVGSTGLVLLVGPTNSGKSTSIQAFIGRIYERRGRTIKVVTIEDPVEYIIESACQMGVPRGKLPPEEIARIYKTLLASTLRQDPDVALVGEIRTSEQAEPAKDMVLAGRKILTTLHAYDALAAFARLAEIGMPASLLTRPGFVSGVIFQRLLPVLCDHCAEPLDPAMVAEGRLRQETFERVWSVADMNKDKVRLRSRSGCKHCDYTGIVGRTPCAEILVPDEKFLRFIRQGDEVGAKNYWHSNGVNTDGAGVRAVAHAIAKMRKGIVDPNDIEIHIGLIEIDRPEAVPSPAYPHSRGAEFTGGHVGGRDEPSLLGLGGRNNAFLNA